MTVATNLEMGLKDGPTLLMWDNMGMLVSWLCAKPANDNPKLKLVKD